MHAQHAIPQGTGSTAAAAAAAGSAPCAVAPLGLPGALGASGASRLGPGLTKGTPRDTSASTMVDSIVLPRRLDDAASGSAAGTPWAHGAAGAPAPLEPQVLLLAAGDTAAAEAWGRGLLSEGLHMECRPLAPGSPLVDQVAARGSAPPAAPTWAPEPAGDGPLLHSRATQAIALHVADALAPQLAQLRALRARWPQLPLVVVVRGLRDLDQVLALEMGADDVIDAALAAPVVAARLRALWRRAAAATVQADGEREPLRELRFGALSLRRLEREVRLADTPVPLTEGEFEVLWLLASHAGQALSRREILKRVRGLDDQPLDRSIDSRVYRIRAKLGDGAAPGTGAARIRTVRHQGYAFSPTGW